VLSIPLKLSLFCLKDGKLTDSFPARPGERYNIKPVAHDAFFRAGSVAGFSYLAPGMGWGPCWEGLAHGACCLEGKFPEGCAA